MTAPLPGCSRLAIGTAQFGMRYGVSNTADSVPDEQIVAILAMARAAGVDTVDTAIAYGDSEQRLGRSGISGWRVVSKLPPLPDGVHDVEHWVFSELAGSLERLGIDQLEGLLLHRPADLLGPNGSAYSRALERARGEGLTRSIGFSIYSPDDLASLISTLRPDLIQAPFNVVDRRLASSGWLEDLSEREIRVHARSAFLQGLLLMPGTDIPAWFDRWRTLLDTWRQGCAALGTSPLVVALRFVLSWPSIERVVVGVASTRQLEEILAAAGTVQEYGFPDVQSQDPELIDPSRWLLD